MVPTRPRTACRWRLRAWARVLATNLNEFARRPSFTQEPPVCGEPNLGRSIRALLGVSPCFVRRTAWHEGHTMATRKGAPRGQLVGRRRLGVVAPRSDATTIINCSFPIRRRPPTARLDRKHGVCQPGGRRTVCCLTTSLIMCPAGGTLARADGAVSARSSSFDRYGYKLDIATEWRAGPTSPGRQKRKWRRRGMNIIIIPHHYVSFATRATF